MRIQTNFNELMATPGFIESLPPSHEVTEARRAFDEAGKNVTPESYAKSMVKINRANNYTAKMVREQYQPIVKKLVLAFLKDWKLTVEDDKFKTCFTSLSFDALQQFVWPVLRPVTEKTNAFLHIANAIKPMILKALKELEKENLVTANRPRFKKWGQVATYQSNGNQIQNPQTV